MKYRLTEDWLEYKKGMVFEKERLQDMFSGLYGYALVGSTFWLLLLKTGILEEVNPSGVFQIVFYDDTEGSKTLLESIPMDKEEALEASEQIKTLLLSLKK